MRALHLTTAIGLLGSLPACSADAGEAASQPAASSGGAAGATGAGGAPFWTPQSSGGELTILGPAGPRECAHQDYRGTLLPSNLLFVVDRSGSMNCNLGVATETCEKTPKTDDPSQPTRWSVITDTLSSALDTLAATPNTSAGLSFFSSDDECGVTSTPKVGLSRLTAPQVSALKTALQNGNPSGGTPIVGATILGFKHLHQQAQAPGNRFVVLMTDGSDSCIDKYAVTGDVVAQLLDVELPKAIAVNIRTFVIGAPGSEAARGLLSKIAFAGGTAVRPACDHESEDPAPGTECHFDMTRSSDFAKDLTSALASINGTTALTCDFDAPEAEGGSEIDTGSLNVDYYRGGDTATPASKVELYRDDTKPCDAGADGWQYIENATKIRLCGPICQQVKTDASPAVIVSVGCEQRIR